MAEFLSKMEVALQNSKRLTVAGVANELNFFPPYRLNRVRAKPMSSLPFCGFHQQSQTTLEPENVMHLCVLRSAFCVFVGPAANGNARPSSSAHLHYGETNLGVAVSLARMGAASGGHRDTRAQDRVEFASG